MVIVASDGLQFLETEDIEAMLNANATESGATIARTFLERLAELDDPDQDNTSIAVIRVSMPGEEAAETPDNVEHLPIRNGEETDPQVKPRRVKVDPSQVSERPKKKAEAQR